jgi:subtilisin family serine protease
MKTLLISTFLILSFQAFGGSYAGWGLGSINMPAKLVTNKEITVAVLDTGIDPTHEHIKGNLVRFLDYSGTGKNDSHGHGTHVAGIIKNIFPKVKLVALKYYNPKYNGKQSLEATVKALKAAVDMNVDVINYSGGGPESSSEELAVLKEAERKGIIVVVAAGNESSNIDNKKHAFYPAAYGLSNIISVSAHDQNLKLIKSSNWGKKLVDLAAPGKRIKSALPYNRAGFLTGTSQATAFVTGVVAIIKSQFPKLSYTEVKNIIRNSAKKETFLASNSNSGGRLDAKAAILEASKGQTNGSIFRELAKVKN